MSKRKPPLSDKDFEMYYRIVYPELYRQDRILNRVLLVLLLGVVGLAIARFAGALP